MWFIGVELEQETSAPPPKKNPGSAPEIHIGRLRRQVYDLLQAFHLLQPASKHLGTLGN